MEFKIKNTFRRISRRKTLRKVAGSRVSQYEIQNEFLAHCFFSSTVIIRVRFRHGRVFVSVADFLLGFISLCVRGGLLINIALKI